jgi:hypothetical protein
MPLAGYWQMIQRRSEKKVKFRYVKRKLTTIVDKFVRFLIKPDKKGDFKNSYK